MNEVLRLLRKEHKDMAVLLDLLERQIALHKQGSIPDFNIVRGILDYFLTYPDLYHHPKEDLILHKLRARDPAMGAELEGLLSGHEALANLTRRFATATVDQMLHADEVPREWFGSLARKFVDSNRDHMAKEEEHFLPVAQEVLTEEDWADLEAHVIGRSDPLFGGKVEEHFGALRAAILELERGGKVSRQSA